MLRNRISKLINLIVTFGLVHLNFFYKLVLIKVNHDLTNCNVLNLTGYCNVYQLVIYVRSDRGIKLVQLLTSDKPSFKSQEFYRNC